MGINFSKESLTGLLTEIVKDINSKVSTDTLDTLITNYLTNNTETLDLETLILRIINENSEEININSNISENTIKEIVDSYIAEETTINKIAEAVNSVDRPFEKAYWKDSSNGKLYEVTMVNGSFSISEYGSSSEGTEDTGEDLSGLEDLLTDRLLIWHDEFDGDSLNTDYWYGGANYWGLEKNDSNNDVVTVSDSICHITSYPQESGNLTGSWNSGCLVQNNKYTIRRGRIETKLKINSCKGTNEAFWTNGVGQWPHFGEIDMIETSDASRYKSALHWSNGNDIGTNTTKSVGGSSFDTDYHIYAIEIEENKLSFYQDNELVWESDTSSNVYYDGINCFSEQIKKIIFDVAITSKSDIPEGTSSVDMWVDWVRIYAPTSITEKTALTPTAISLQYLGTQEKIKNGNTIYLNDVAIISPIYTPDTVEQRCCLFEISDSSILNLIGDSSENSGCILGAKEGTTTLTATNILSGLSTSIEFTVKSDTENKISVTDLNILDVDLSNINYWVTGSLYVTDFAFSSVITNGYLSCESKTEYSLNNNINGMSKKYRLFKIFYYNSSKKLLGNSEDIASSGTFTTPENCTFVKLEFRYYTGASLNKAHYYTNVLNRLKNATITITKSSEEEASTVLCTGITLDKTEITLDSTTPTATLTATVEPSDCSQPVEWTSNGFVTVKDGVVTVVSMGSDVVTVTCGEYSTTCNVTILGVPD